MFLLRSHIILIHLPISALIINFMIQPFTIIQKIKSLFILYIDKNISLDRFAYKMPKVETIISQLQTKSFQVLPDVSHILESDIDRLHEALKKQKNDRSYYAVLRVVLAEVKKKLGHKDYIKPLLEISLTQLQSKPYIQDLKLRICEAIIECQELHRINLLEHIVNQLTIENLQELSLRVRLEVARAGKQSFKGDFTKAAFYYLNASREEALLKNQQQKIELINKSIAFSYVSPKTNENHKTICSLCMNELSKKSILKDVLEKLYTEDIITKEDSKKIEKYLPEFLNKSDVDGVSVLSQAKFSHNMVPIMNCFRVVKFSTLSRLLSMPIQQVLILLEKTFGRGEVRIDQEEEMIEIKEKMEGSEKSREFFNRIDEIIKLDQ